MSQRTRLIRQVGSGLADLVGDLRDQVPTEGWVLSHPVMQGTASPTTAAPTIEDPLLLPPKIVFLRPFLRVSASSCEGLPPLRVSPSGRLAPDASEEGFDQGGQPGCHFLRMAKDDRDSIGIEFEVVGVRDDVPKPTDIMESRHHLG